jgi:virulence-associated protein VagC
MSRAGRRVAPKSKSYRAKVFKNGGSQAIRLPKECRVEGEEVIVRKRGDRLVIEPAHAESTWSPAFVKRFLRGLPNPSFPDRPEQGRQAPRRPL